MEDSELKYSRDRGVKSDLSVFGSLILKDANPINLLLDDVMLNHITSRVFTELLWPIIPPHSSGVSVEHLLKNFLRIYVYEWFCLHMCLYTTCVPGVPGGQKRVMENWSYGWVLVSEAGLTSPLSRGFSNLVRL